MFTHFLIENLFKEVFFHQNTNEFKFFLLGLWASFEKDPLTINNEIENLSKLEENYEHYRVICELLNLIDNNNWAKAKYFWLHDHLKLEPSQNEYDCFGCTHTSEPKKKSVFGFCFSFKPKTETETEKPKFFLFYYGSKHNFDDFNTLDDELYILKLFCT